MKNSMKYWQSFVVIVGIVLALAIAPAPKALASNNNLVYPPDKAVYGMTYGDWAAAWWQYVFSVPSPDNPILDTTGEKCDEQQSTCPVFFLVGAFGGSVTRNCTVPAGKAIFFPILNFECDTLSPPTRGGNEWELRTCVGKIADFIDVNSLKVTIDGKKLHRLQRFRVQSPVFHLTVPVDNFLGWDPASGLAVTDGYYVMLKPLSPGSHVVHFEGSIPSISFTLSITYNLTVTP